MDKETLVNDCVLFFNISLFLIALGLFQTSSSKQTRSEPVSFTFYAASVSGEKLGKDMHRCVLHSTLFAI